MSPILLRKQLTQDSSSSSDCAPPSSSSSHVNVEGLQDAPVHQLPDARDDPGRPPAGRQIHGLRPPHEPRPRRLRGVPQAPSGESHRQNPGRQGGGARGPPYPRPRPPPRRGGRLHDRRGPTSPRRRQIPRRGPPHLRPRRPQRRPRRRKRNPHRPAHPGPARPCWPGSRHRRAHPGDDAAPDRPSARLLPAPHAPARPDATWLPRPAPSPDAGPDAHDDEARWPTPATWALPDAAVWAEADGGPDAGVLLVGDGGGGDVVLGLAREEAEPAVE